VVAYQAIELLAVQGGKGARRQDGAGLFEQGARRDKGRAGIVRAGFGVARHGCCDARKVGARAAWGDVCSSTTYTVASKVKRWVERALIVDRGEQLRARRRWKHRLRGASQSPRPVTSHVDCQMLQAEWLSSSTKTPALRATAKSHEHTHGWPRKQTPRHALCPWTRTMSPPWLDTG
jgi:hypothetical protein